MPKLPVATTPAEAKKLKIKLAVLAGVIAIGLIWITISIAGSSMFKPKARTLESPQWTAAREHTAQLVLDNRFLDVAVIPAENDASRFVVVGAVHKAADLQPLKTKLAELIPGENYEFKVEVLP